MPAIIFICVLIFFIVFLLASFVKIELEYDADFFVKVKYLCFTLFMTPKSKRMLKKEKKKEEKERKKRERLLRKKREKGQHLKGKKPEQPKNSGDKTAIPEKCSDKEQSVKIQQLSDKNQNSSDSKKNKPQNSDEKDKLKPKPKPKPETVIGCIKAAKPHVKRLFKKIRFYDIFSEIVVGGDDAAKTAIAYGVHCAAVYGLVCFLKNTVSFKEKKIDIKANFDLEKTDYYFYGKVKLRLSTLLYCAVWGFLAVKKAMSEDQSQRGNVKDSKGAPKKAA